MMARSLEEIEKAFETMSRSNPNHALNFKPDKAGLSAWMRANKVLLTEYAEAMDLTYEEYTKVSLDEIEFLETCVEMFGYPINTEGLLDN